MGSPASGVAKAAAREGAVPPKASSVKFLVLYTSYIDDIIASCDVLDVTLV